MEPLGLVAFVLLFSLIGTAAGVITGLTPGIHVNTVASLILASQAGLLTLAGSLLAWASPSSGDLLVMVAALVIGNVVSHTFLDYIPSIFLGAPEGETALSVLPGHRMLLKGKGLVAVRLSAVGSAVAALLSLLLILPFRLVMGDPVNAYEDLRPYVHLLLILVSSLFILAERGGSLLTATHLVCALPEGLVQEGEEIPGVQEAGPSEAPQMREAFLLRGSLVEWSKDRAILEDEGTRIDVSLTGNVDTPISGEVALLVAPELTVGPAAHLLGRGWALAVFLLAGALGYLVLSTPLMTVNLVSLSQLASDPRTAAFLPLFTGLFGLPTLLFSLLNSPSIPPQDRLRSGELDVRTRIRATVGGSLAGALVAWIPGLTAAAATVLSQLFSGRRKADHSDEEFVLSVSCVNTSAAIFTILALFVLLRARSGGMAAVQAIAGPVLTPWDPLTAVPQALLLFLMAAILSAGISFYLTSALGSVFARLITRVPYRLLALSIVMLLLTAIFLLSGTTGLLVAGVATAIGLLPPLVGIRRIHLMGSLILPLVLLLA